MEPFQEYSPKSDLKRKKLICIHTIKCSRNLKYWRIAFLTLIYIFLFFGPFVKMLPKQQGAIKANWLSWPRLEGCMVIPPHRTSLCVQNKQIIKQNTWGKWKVKNHAGSKPSAFRGCRLQPLYSRGLQECHPTVTLKIPSPILANPHLEVPRL